MLKLYNCARLQPDASGSDVVTLHHSRIAVSGTTHLVPHAARAGGTCHC
jgi:hypothetical protein